MALRVRLVAGYEPFEAKHKSLCCDICHASVDCCMLKVSGNMSLVASLWVRGGRYGVKVLGKMSSG